MELPAHMRFHEASKIIGGWEKRTCKKCYTRDEYRSLRLKGDTLHMIHMLCCDYIIIDTKE